MKLVGVQGDMPKGRFVAISEWMKNGNIMEYIRKNPVNRLELVRNLPRYHRPCWKFDNSCMGQPRVWSTSTALTLCTEILRGCVSFRFPKISPFDLCQANILMSNDEPPRACLADFGFMTMVLDPEHPMTCSTQLDGGTLTFMSPEILAPGEFGLKNSVLTLQSDVYAFGLVIFQVCKNHCRRQLLIYFV